MSLISIICYINIMSTFYISDISTLVHYIKVNVDDQLMIN